MSPDICSGPDEAPQGIGEDVRSVKPSLRDKHLVVFIGDSVKARDDECQDEAAFPHGGVFKISKRPREKKAEDRIFEEVADFVGKASGDGWRLERYRGKCKNDEGPEPWREMMSKETIHHPHIIEQEWEPVPWGRVSVLVALFFLFHSFFIEGTLQAEIAPRRGLWVSVIEEKAVLGDRKKIDELVRFSKRQGFDTLFVQVYRAGEAWLPSAGKDPSVGYLIREAHANRIEVHAWINALSVAENRNAPILEKYGEGVLTRDQHGDLPLREGEKETGRDSLDSPSGQFELERQLFLEPGDARVREYLSGAVDEIVATYPGLDGIHFDYIRYPGVVPFVPGSRFNNLGLTYGYAEYNIRRFKDKTGIDPRKVAGQREDAAAWDQWKRDQVTDTLKALVRSARKVNPKLRISCAVLPSLDRFYEGAFQDWPSWLEEGFVDFVVLMNYTDDRRRFRLAGEAAVGMSGDSRRILLGVGSHLLKKGPMEIRDFFEVSESLPVGGIVVFNYTSFRERVEP